jgi:hypothetical protein
MLEILKKEEERSKRKPIYFVEPTGNFHLPLFFFLRLNNFKGFATNLFVRSFSQKNVLRKAKNIAKDVDTIAKLAKY